jgi:hypothetical protein
MLPQSVWSQWEQAQAAITVAEQVILLAAHICKQVAVAGLV